MTADATFIHEFSVGDKTFRLDALLVLSELTLAGAEQEPTKEQLMASVRASVRPQEMSASLTDAEALALALRVTMSLKHLGNAGAP